MRTQPKISNEETRPATDCATKRAIIEAAQSRFLHYGFKKTTIDDIAFDAGVGKGTVYLYFDGKEDILLTIVREVKANITEQMRTIAASPLTTPEDKLRRMLLSAIISVYEASQTTAHGVELVGEMLQPRLMQCGRDAREAQFAIIAGVVEEGVRRGDFSLPPGADASQVARLLMMAMVSFFPPYMTPCHAEATCRGQMEARANAMLTFVMHGLSRR